MSPDIIAKILLVETAGVYLKSLFEALHGSTQVLDAQAIGDTHLMTALLGVGIEAGGRGKHHGSAVVAEVGEQPLAELVAIVDRQLGHGVERALGHGTETTGDIVDGLDHHITTCHILFGDSVEVLLRGVNGSFAEDLAETGRTETSLSKTHGNGIDLGIASDEATDTGTASTIALGDGVEQDDMLLQAGQLHDTEVLVAVVAELAIHLVGKEEEVVLLHYLGHLFQLFFGIEIAGGVAGVAYHDGAGARRDSFLELLDGRQSEAGLDIAGYGLDDSIAHAGEAVVVGVVRFGNKYLIAGVETDGESKLQRFAAARGDDDLVGGNGNVVLGIVFHQLLAIGDIAGAVAVGQHTYLGLGHSLESTFGSLDIGLTDVEVIHMCAFGFGSIGIGN